MWLRDSGHTTTSTLFDILTQKTPFVGKGTTQ